MAVTTGYCSKCRQRVFFLRHESWWGCWRCWQCGALMDGERLMWRVLGGLALMFLFYLFGLISRF